MYTAWSRAIYIPPDTTEEKEFVCIPIALPPIVRANNDLEPMTLWEREKKNGKVLDKWVPKEPAWNQSLWKIFGFVETKDFSEKNKERMPGIVQWIYTLRDENILKGLNFEMVSVGMKGDRTNSSTPIDEIHDELSINALVFADTKENGWRSRIFDQVELTKDVVEGPYQNFISALQQMRGRKVEPALTLKVEEMFFQINQPFKEWLSKLSSNTDKEEAVSQWKRTLKKLVWNQAKKDMGNPRGRDYLVTEVKIKKEVECKGRKKKNMEVKKFQNLPIAYNELEQRLGELLGRGK